MKIILRKHDKLKGYYQFEGSQTKNFILYDFYEFLSMWWHKSPDEIYEFKGMHWEWLTLNKTEDGRVYLYNTDQIKRQAEREYSGPLEKDAYDRAYSEYNRKRFKDIPKLYMKIENYVEIVEKWHDIALGKKPSYIIVSQDDTGYVDLVGKDELSQQDLHDMKIEHEKYIKYEVAYEKYVKSRPSVSDELWHGPESEEYEADWQKFLQD